MISKINNMNINYNIINDKNHNKELAIKKYYKDIGCNYDIN